MKSSPQFRARWYRYSPKNVVSQRGAERLERRRIRVIASNGVAEPDLLREVLFAYVPVAAVVNVIVRIPETRERYPVLGI